MSKTGPESGDEPRADAESKAAEQQPVRARKPVSARRLDEVFGDVLPDTTSDERDPSPPDASRDEWFEANRPPHH